MRNTFSGAALDRAAAHRSDDRWVSERLAEPGARALLVAPEGAYADCSTEPCRPALVPVSELGAVEEPVLLGLDGAGAVFALAADGGERLDGAAPMNLREAGARMSQEDGGLVAYGTAIVGWHRAHRFCARCGAPTRMAEAGFLRECPRCGAHHHPRTDPVVIMLVHDRDRVLLGRQPTWPPGRYSALAGFVEPGESLEEAVVREVREEAAVEVDEIRYSSSQPWPFPSSLMLAFHARYVGGTATAEDAELDDVRWFERAELAAVARGETDFHLPPPLAIARRLIDEWLG